MKYSFIISDLDKTLAGSKEAISQTMAKTICEYLNKNGSLSIISGGNLQQIKEQVINYLPCFEQYAKQIYLQPSSGSKMYAWDIKQKKWNEIYNNDFNSQQRDKIINAIQKVLSQKPFPEPELLWGPQIQDRGSQISFSALGQNAPREPKSKWDPDKKKRKKAISLLKPLLPEFRIAYGGSTTIDITQKGLSKAYGINQFLKYASIKPQEVVFIGDSLEKDGNDYPAYSTEVQVRKTKGPKNTEEIINSIISGKK